MLQVVFTGLIYLSKVTDIETHLVMSNWAKENIKLETDYSVAEVENLADFVYDNQNLGAAIASGSFRVDGMVIAPASMKTVAGISIGFVGVLHKAGLGVDTDKTAATIQAGTEGIIHGARTLVMQTPDGQIIEP